MQPEVSEWNVSWKVLEDEFVESCKTLEFWSLQVLESPLKQYLPVYESCSPMFYNWTLWLQLPDSTFPSPAGAGPGRILELKSDRIRSRI